VDLGRIRHGNELPSLASQGLQLSGDTSETLPYPFERHGVINN